MLKIICLFIFCLNNNHFFSLSEIKRTLELNQKSMHINLIVVRILMRKIQEPRRTVSHQCLLGRLYVIQLVIIVEARAQLQSSALRTPLHQSC